jgi:YidC/Oxa1 family membrane protein insertase
MDKRTILAIVLSLAVLMIYQMFFLKPPSPRQPQPDQKAEAPAAKHEVAERVAPPAGVVSTGPVLLQKVAGSEKDVQVETPLYRAVFTTRGGSLKSFQLKGYNRTLPPDRLYPPLDFLGLFRQKGMGQSSPEGALPIEMVQLQDGMPRPLGIAFPDSSVNIPQEGIYESDAGRLEIVKEGKGQSLTFFQVHKGSIKVEKTYTFHPDKFSFDLEVRLTNLSGAPLSENINLSWHQYADPKSDADQDGHRGPITYVTQTIDRPEIAKIEAENVLGPNVSWSGYEDKYFIASMIPRDPSLTTVAVAKDARSMVSVSLRGPKNVIPPGQTGQFSYSLYLGPKDYNLLKALGIGLENAVDFGSILKWLAMPLLLILKFLYQYVHNYGIAIIILTVLIKILFWPLGNKSYKAMKEMQKLQPKIQELQQKYKDDKQKLGQETMALYKTHHVNPLGGCLPMLIQIPVFFGFYTALLYAIELRHSPFFWWIQDLSAKDPYYITPIIMGATMFIQQKMSPPMGDPMQAKIMMWMPVIFTFMFLNFSSGLVIYWLFNNLLSIGQQYYINKKSS